MWTTPGTDNMFGRSCMRPSGTATTFGSKSCYFLFFTAYHFFKISAVPCLPCYTTIVAQICVYASCYDDATCNVVGTTKQAVGTLIAHDIYSWISCALLPSKIPFRQHKTRHAYYLEYDDCKVNYSMQVGISSFECKSGKVQHWCFLMRKRSPLPTESRTEGKPNANESLKRSSF